MPQSVREFDVLIDGSLSRGIADHIHKIGQEIVAIEAKYVKDWAGSIMNPDSPVAAHPWARSAQDKLLFQARRYSSAFDSVLYHTNSRELAEHLKSFFGRNGLGNISIKITSCKFE